MQEEKIRPVTILTGFLGSGKTTFLNALMAKNPEKRYAIIENEIGEINVDGKLVSNNYDQLIELQNGCLCCTLNDDLYGALDILHQQAASFDELIIECTGLALPATVIEPFTVHPIFKKYFPLKRTVCMVDAELIEDQLEERDEALRQLTSADAVVINKTDFVHSEYVMHLRARLGNLNPLAKIFQEEGKGVFPFAQLEKVSYSIPKTLFSIVKHGKAESTGITKKWGVSHNIHNDITVRTYTFSEEFNFVHLYLGLSKLVGKHRDKIYRMKGIGYKTDEQKRIVVQSVGARIDMDYGGYWKEDEDRQNTIVFIGKDIDNLHINQLLHELLYIN